VFNSLPYKKEKTMPTTSKAHIHFAKVKHANRMAREAAGSRSSAVAWESKRLEEGIYDRMMV